MSIDISYKVKANLFKNIPAFWFKTVYISFESIGEKSYSFVTKDNKKLTANVLEKSAPNILIAISENSVFALGTFLLGLYLYHSIPLAYIFHLGIYTILLSVFAWNCQSKKLISNESISFALCQIAGFVVLAKLFFFDFYVGNIFLYITFVFASMFIMRFFSIKNHDNIKLLATADRSYFFIVDFNSVINKQEEVTKEKE